MCRSVDYVRIRSLSIAALVVFLILGVATTEAQNEKSSPYGIFFDNTGSMFTQLEHQRELGQAILSKIPEASPISIFGMATVPNANRMELALASGARCSKDRTLLSEQIGTIQVARPGQTILIDALLTSGRRLSESIPGCEADTDRILVILTDGEDRASISNADVLIAELRKLRVHVYVVALLDNLSKSNVVAKSSFKRSREFLLKLAQESGGRIVFSRKKSSAEEIVSELFAENYSFPKK